MRSMAKRTTDDVTAWLRGRATRWADVEESIASAGTPNEASTYMASKKAFLFVASRDDLYELRLKLGASKAEASRFSSKTPDRFAIGATGWAKITFPKTEAGPRAILERWIDESHALFVPANASTKAGPARKLVPPSLPAKKAKPSARAKR